MSDNRPKNQLINVNFYKTNGKWYTRTQAVVNHFLFEDGFEQDIVDTQNGLVDGWQNHNNYYVVTSAPEHVNGFFEALFHPGEFRGYKRKEVSKDER